MSECVTTGIWIVDEANRDAFVEAWSDFAEWACGKPGAGTLRLGHDQNDPRRHVSFGVWDSPAAVQAWRTDPEFRDRLARVLQHVDEFDSTNLDVLATRTSAGRVSAGVDQ